MGKAKRRILMILGLFVMLTGTGFLAESLLFRVTGVRITGDPVYPEEQIKTICNFKAGDNLLFIPTGEKERALQEQLPYIGKAKISRRIPGTVVIEVAAAQPACCIQVGGSWLVVDGGGKVLENRADPIQGILQVSGLAPSAAQPGKTIVLEDEAAAAAFTEIVEKVSQLEAANDFTRLNMANMEDIRLWYQDRVECKLGGTAQLDYKIQTGYNLFHNEGERGIGQNEKGVLDLSYSDTKTFYFSPGEVDPSTAVQAAPPTESGEQEPGGEHPQNSEPSSEEPTASPEGRGAGIPDQPFTG